MIRTGLALVVVAIVAALPLAATAQGKKSSDFVKVTATADKPDANGKQTVTITLDIEKPWHLYANPVGLEDIADAATVVEITGKAQPQSVKVKYPAGKVKKDRTFGNYMIYEGKIEIKADVVRAKGETGPLKATVKIQACDEGSCLRPSTVNVEIP